MEALKHNDKILYSVLIGLSLLFMIADLTCGFTGHLDCASVFSILSAGIIGIGAYKTRAFKINSSVDSSIGYIKKNFDHWNIILSLLDVICSIIAVFSGVVIVGVLSGIGFFGRIVALIYKFRSVSFVILGFAIIYLFKRRGKKMADENVAVEATVTTASTIENTATTVETTAENTAIPVQTKKISIPQWATIIVAILGSAYGVACYFVPDIVMFGDQIISMLSGFGITTVSAIVGVFTTYATKSSEEIAKAVEKQKAKAEAKAEKTADTYIEQATAQLAEKQQAEIKALAETLKTTTTTTTV